MGPAKKGQALKVLLGVLSAVAVMPIHAEDLTPPWNQMETQGPWTYGNPEMQGDSTSHIAITRAGESSDVWFSFACAKDLRIFASILDQSGIPASIGDDISVDIQLPNITKLTTSAKKVSDTIMAFNPDLSEKLFIYAIYEKALHITFSNSKLGTRTYTFQLQPNNVAFQRIIDACPPQHPDQNL